MHVKITLIIIIIASIITNCTPIKNEDTIQVTFCPNCTNVYVQQILSANQSIYCAFFELNNPKIINAIALQSDKDVKIILDNLNQISLPFPTQYEQSSRYMHHKYCVIDNKIVITGSTNPTTNGLEKNANDIVIIKSTQISKAYISNFVYLWNDTPQTTFHSQIRFCPLENCEQAVIEQIDAANKSIYFAQFAFTSQRIANHILLKKENVTIIGIIDKKMFSRSVAPLLKHYNISMKKSNWKPTLHHKFFIIDEKIVITGSYNPSNRGGFYNYENIIIIKNETIAKKYVNRMLELY